MSLGPEGEGLLAGVDGRGAGGQAAAEVVGVGGRAGVAELRDDPPARLVDGFGDLRPAGGLLVGVDAGDVDVADRVGADPGSLGDDQAGAGALCVVGGVQVGGDQLGVVGTGAGHGGHDDAVGELQGAEADGLKQGLAGHE